MYEDYCKLWNALQKDIDEATKDDNAGRKLFFFQNVLPKVIENTQNDMFNLKISN